MQVPLPRQGCDLDQYSFQSQRKAMPKNVQTTVQLNSFYVLVRLCSKFFKLGFNWEIPDVRGGFRKGRETRDQIANICWIMEKARGFQKNIYCFIDYTKAFDCVDHKKLWKILQEMGIPGHLIFLLGTCLQVKKQQLELDMEQWTDSKLGKE